MATFFEAPIPVVASPGEHPNWHLGGVGVELNLQRVPDGTFSIHNARRFDKPWDDVLTPIAAIISIDWHSVFVPGIGIAEVVVRGSLMYLCMLAILRFVGRRRPADLLVIVMIADAAQNALKVIARSQEA